MRHRITIQQAVKSSDGMGGFVETWGPICTVWASMRQESGKELVNADKIQASRRVQYGIRYRADIAANMRILHGSRTLNIVAVLDPAGTFERLELIAEEVDADGS